MRESREKLFFEIDEATGHVKSLAEISEREREESTVKKVDRSQVSHASSKRYANVDSDEENTAQKVDYRKRLDAEFDISSSKRSKQPVPELPKTLMPKEELKEEPKPDPLVQTFNPTATQDIGQSEKESTVEKRH